MCDFVVTLRYVNVMSEKRLADEDDEAKKVMKKGKKGTSDSSSILDHEIASVVEDNVNSIAYRNSLIDSVVSITCDTDINTSLYRKSLIESTDQNDTAVGITDNVANQNKNRIWLAAPSGNRKTPRLGDDYQAII